MWHFANSAFGWHASLHKNPQGGYTVEVLNDLLRIKVFREVQAERALAKARQRLAEARQVLREAENNLSNFRNESLQREKALYSDLCSRLVVLREIEDVRTDIELMKEKAERLAGQVEDARRTLDEVAWQAEQARREHRDAVRMREKFDELVQQEQAELESERSRLEELEMEEAAAGRFAFQRKSDESDSQATAAEGSE